MNVSPIMNDDDNECYLKEIGAKTVTTQQLDTR